MKRKNIEDELLRPTHEKNEISLFGIEPDRQSDWWEMPEYNNDDIRPTSQIIISFLTDEDRKDFAEKMNIRISANTKSLWFPCRPRLVPGKYYFDGPKVDSKYPICLPSKGRYDCQTTGKLLDEMGITNYFFFVEETEGKKYKRFIGEDKVIVMPFHDLGQGSVPARNFIWDWCKERGYKRHWTVDDNIERFTRNHLTRRLKIQTGMFFRAMEDFVDRYENIAMAGPHEQGFITGWTNRPPFSLNTRIYSCILLDTTLPYRWRGRYNEDTDLSLRLLKDGYCTCIFNALLMDKGATQGSRGKAMKGGNTDNVYNTDDHRLAFAESLRDQHPDCVEITWRFNRWHHLVDYSKFKRNKLQLKKGIVPTKRINEYGIKLIRKEDD